MSGYALNMTGNSSLPSVALIMQQLSFWDPLINQGYWNGSLNFKDITTPISNFAVVASENGNFVYQNKTPAAHECVLWWCTKRTAASFANGNLEEKILSIFTNDTTSPNPLLVTPDDLDSTGLDYTYTQNVSITPTGQTRPFSLATSACSILVSTWTWWFQVSLRRKALPPRQCSGIIMTFR